MKKLLSRLPCCTTAAVGGVDEYSDSSSTGDASSPSATPSSTTTLQSTLSLQTLPSVPSLQSFSLLDTTTITLSLSHSSSLSLSSSASSITCIALHGSSLYATSGHQISVYDHSTLAHLDTFNSDCASAGVVKSVAFADGKVLTAHQDGRIRVWKHHVQKHGQQQNHNHNNNNNHKLVSTLPTVKDRLLRFPFPNSHVQVRRHKRRLWVEHHDAVSGLTVSTNNNKNGNVYSISWDKTLKVWAPKKGFKCLESVTAHDDAINAVTVNSDGTVYTGSADGRIGVWGKSSSEDDKRKRHVRVATLEKHKSAVNALALSADGSVLFSGACDRSILVWEREDSAKYMVVSGALRGHDGAILCLINVADFLISGSADRTVRIWRRGVEGKYCCLKVLVGHLKPVKSLAAKMEEEVDELTVFSGALDGEIKVWKIKVNYNF